MRGGGNAVRKVSKTANLTVVVISVLLILMVINFLVARHLIWRIDLTENKLYTISPSSKKLVGNLKDLVTIKAYFSQKLPPYLSNVRQDVEDLLKEYQAFAKGNLRVEFIDPTTENEELKRKLAFDGVPPINLQTIDKHALEVMEAYFGMTINYEDRKEAIPIIDPETLEYDLSAAIKKVSMQKPVEIGIIINKDTIDIEKDYQSFMRSVQKLYQVRPLKLEEGQKIPEDVDILLIISPKNFSESELYEIDQFVMRGGKLICLVDAINIDQRTLQATVDKPNIAKILVKYGIQVNDDLIEDYRSPAIASFSTGYMQTMIRYPFWVSVEKDLNRENAITKRLTTLVLPWVSSLATTDKIPDGVKITTLASTTDAGYKNSAPFNLNPFNRERPKITKSDVKKYALAFLADGEFPSAYKGKPIPKTESPTATDKVKGEPPTLRGTSQEQRKDKSVKTSIMVVGNSFFPREQFLYATRSNNNLAFLENTIDSMAIGQDLIGIRMRASATRPLNNDLTDSQKTTYKWLSILGVPILVILLGIIRIPLVRAKRRYYEMILTRGDK